eukprot:135181-Chlamydomonas_euryale.AAC.2
MGFTWYEHMGVGQGPWGSHGMNRAKLPWTSKRLERDFSISSIRCSCGGPDCRRVRTTERARAGV